MNLYDDEIKFRKESDDNNLLEVEEQYIHLQITIRDTGIGIKQENLKNLFINFGKLEDFQGRNKSGTGLGLSICKEIIE